MGRDGYRLVDPSRFNQYSYQEKNRNVTPREEIEDTPPKKKNGSPRDLSKVTVYSIESDHEDENIHTPLSSHLNLPSSSSGWLEKTSHQPTSSKNQSNHRNRNDNRRQVHPPLPSSSKLLSTQQPSKKKVKIIHDSDEDDDEEDEREEELKEDRSEESAKEEDEEEGEEDMDNLFKDIAPTVIYQLQEDNLTKLLKERENKSLKNGEKKKIHERESRLQQRRNQGCSLSRGQSNKAVGRLLKKKIRSLSLTDSDVESMDELNFKLPSSERILDSEDELIIPKKKTMQTSEIIDLESDDDDDQDEDDSNGSDDNQRRVHSRSSPANRNTSHSKSQSKSKSKPIVVKESESESGSGSGSEEELQEEDEEEDSFHSEDDHENEERKLESDSDADDGEKWYGSDDESVESNHQSTKRKRSSSDDEKTDEDLRKEMERKCRRVLQRCADVSKLLRKALLSWSTTGEESDELTQIGCVNLISIHEQNANIISQEMIIQNISPQLTLKDYQLVGLNWLKLMHTNDVNGVLADDMGLGKTVQTIGFVGWLYYDRTSRNKSPHTHLIVVPASTLSNWIKEFARFCPHLKVLRFHGTVTEKDQVKHKLRRMLANRSNSHGHVDVVLTTYTQFERESGAEDRKFLRKIPFEYLILDEAHCIKNSQSSRYSNLRNLNTKRRLLLSGTPVQNDVRELLSLLGFLMPQVFKAEYIELLLGSLKLEHLPEQDQKNTKSKVSKKKEKEKGKDGMGSSSSSLLAASSLLEENTNESIASLENLRIMLGPFVLRRLKRDVLNQLVEKEEHVLMLQMTETQQQLYGDIIQRHMLRRTQISSKSSGSSLVDLTGVEDAKKIVRNISASEANNIFTALRKAANHPLLLRVHFSQEATIDLIASICQSTGHFGDQCDLKRITNEIQEMSDFDINSICLEYPSLLGHLQLRSSVLYESPKMKKLESLLPQLINDGHRILIFSQWTKMLDIIGALMEDMALKFLRLDGSTPVRERQNLIDRFERDRTIPIFILSTKAGGLGINLTAADTVIIYDLDFNPENDRQAEDRCHRIGQTKPVTVYKLVTEETVDEIIYETGQRKQRLTKAVLSDNPHDETSVGKEFQDGDGPTVSGKEINKMLEAALQNYLKK